MHKTTWRRIEEGCSPHCRLLDHLFLNFFNAGEKLDEGPSDHTKVTAAKSTENILPLPISLEVRVERRGVSHTLSLTHSRRTAVLSISVGR